MHKRTWWKQLHRPEYGADLLGTAFLLFAGLSAVVLDFGAGSPLARIIPEKSPRLLITGLLFAGSGSLVAVSQELFLYHSRAHAPLVCRERIAGGCFALGEAARRAYQSRRIAGVLGPRENASL